MEKHQRALPRIAHRLYQYASEPGGSIAWIASHPGAFAELTAQRGVRFWFPYLGGYRYAIPMGALTVISVIGLALIYRENRIAAFLFAATLFAYPLIHYPVQFEARCRYPIFWATRIPAAYALTRVVQRSRATSGDQEKSSNTRDELVRVCSAWCGRRDSNPYGLSATSS